MPWGLELGLKLGNYCNVCVVIVKCQYKITHSLYCTCQLHFSAQSSDFPSSVCSCTSREGAGRICERCIDQRLWPALAEDTKTGQGSGCRRQVQDRTDHKLLLLGYSQSQWITSKFTHIIQHICEALDIFCHDDENKWIEATENLSEPAFHWSDEWQEVTLETWQVVGFLCAEYSFVCQNINKSLIHFFSRLKNINATYANYVSLGTK